MLFSCEARCGKKWVTRNYDLQTSAVPSGLSRIKIAFPGSELPGYFRAIPSGLRRNPIIASPTFNHFRKVTSSQLGFEKWRRAL